MFFDLKLQEPNKFKEFNKKKKIVDNLVFEKTLKKNSMILVFCSKTINY